MTKDRPFKNYKTPSERPFKTYNPVRSSMLFEDYQQQQQQQQLQVQQQQSHQEQQQQQQQLIPQSALRLNAMNSLLHQQQQQQQQQQQVHMFSQQQQQNSTPTSQQVYGDPEDFIHLNPQQTVNNPIMNLDPSIDPYYDDLGLDDTDSPLIRPELLVANDTLLQREQDLNIPNTTAPPNFIMPSSRHAGTMRLPPSNVPASIQDSLSMLFDSPQLSTSPYSSPTASSAAPSHSSILQQQQLLLSKPSSDTSRSLSPSGNNHNFMSAISPSLQASLMASVQNSSNGRSCPGSNGMHPSSSGVSFPVKQEADEGQQQVIESPTPSVQSPTQSEPADSFTDTPRMAVKRSHSECSDGALSEQGAQSEEGASGSGDVKPDASKDPAYLEKRRKNNESAKRSREARRSKEELVALRVITLEEENMKLRAEITLLDKELEELRNRLFL